MPSCPKQKEDVPVFGKKMKRKRRQGAKKTNFAAARKRDRSENPWMWAHEKRDTTQRGRRGKERPIEGAKQIGRGQKMRKKGQQAGFGSEKPGYGWHPKAVMKKFESKRARPRKIGEQEKGNKKGGNHGQR